MRYLLLFVWIWLSAASLLQAQLPFALGGPTGDAATDIVRDAANHIYVLTNFSGTQPIDFDPTGNTLTLTATDSESDIALAKYTADGALVWAVALRGPQADVGYSLALSPDGSGIYMVGSFNGTLDVNPGPGVDLRTSLGQGDAFLARFRTADGSVAWANTFGGTGNDFAFDVAVDPQDRVYISGVYQSVVDFDPGAGSRLVTTAGLSDNYLASYEGSNGAFVWVNPIGGIQDDFAGTGGTGVALDNQGGVYITGLFAGSADFNPDPNLDFPLIAIGGLDHFVARYETTSGAFFWASGFGGFDNETAGIGGLAWTPNGQVALTGGFRGTGESYPTPGPFIDSKGGVDVLLVGFDAGTGDIRWSVGFGGPQDDAALRLITDGGNEYYLTGEFRGTADFDPLVSSQFILESRGTGGASDVFVGRYGPIGNFIWAVSAGPVLTGAANNTTGLGLAWNGSLNRLYATGQFFGTTDFNPGPELANLVSAGGADAFVWSLDGNGQLTQTIACPPPALLTSSSVTENSAVLVWPAVAQAGSYEVTFGPLNDPSPTTTSGFAGTQFSASNLQPNTLYRIAVRSECGADRSAVIDFAFLTSDLPPQPCPLPLTPSVNNLTPTQARLDWTAFPNVISYEISYREVGAPNFIVVPNLPTATLQLLNLRPATAYEVRLRNECVGLGFTPFSDLLTFTTPGILDQCLNAVRPPVVVETTPTSVRLNWTAAPGANFYELQYRRAGDAFWIALPGTTALQALVADLISNTEYEFRLRVNCSGTPSPFTSVVRAVTGTVASPACDVPTDVSVEEISESRAVVRWQPTANALRYEVSYRTTRGFITVQVPNIPGTELELTNLLTATEYGVRVRSICASGSSAFSQELFFRTAQPPIICFTPAVSVGSVGETTATVFGANVLDEYEVEFKAEGATQFTSTIASVVPFRLENLLPGTRYELRIRNRCPNNTFSPYSASVVFTTDRAPDPCPTPARLTVEVLGPTLARVSWPEAVAFYRLEYRIEGGDSWISGFFTESGPILLRNLQPATPYEVRVVPICDGLDGQPSPNELFFTGAAAPCPTPVARLLTVDQTSATLSYAPDAAIYEIGLRPAGTGAFTEDFTLDNPLTLTGLPPGTAFEFRVRRICPDGLPSEWSNTVLFTTEVRPIICATPVVSLVSNFGGSVTLSWPPVPDALSYEVFFGVVGSSLVETRVTFTPFIQLNDLEPGTEYRYQVRSRCGTEIWSLFTETQTFRTGDLGCPRPALTLADSGPDFLLFDVEPGDAAAYLVEYRPQNGTDFVQVLTPGGGLVLLSNLAAGITYEVRATSRCVNGGLSDLSGLVLATTQSLRECLTPRLTLANLTPVSAVVAWNPSDAGYEISIRRSGQPEFVPFFEQGQRNTFAFNSLQPNTQYEVRVRNFCGDRFSGFSNVLTFRTPEQPTTDDCPAPDLQLVGLERNAATFNWSPPASAFEIGFRLADSPVWSTFAVMGTQPFRLPNLTAGTRYEFRVRNLCAGNRYSPYSNVVSFTTLGDGPPPAVCSAPAPRIEEVSSTTARIGWPAVENAVEYEIERSGPDGVQTAFSVAPTFMWANLAPATRYTVRVRTRCRSGVSPNSVQLVIDTPQQPTGDACFTPTGLDFEDITDRSVRVVWSPVPGALRYQLLWRQAGQPNTLRSVETVAPTVTLNLLIPNFPYEVQVRAVCTGGRASDFTAFRRFVTRLNREAAIAAEILTLEMYPNPTTGPLTIRGLEPNEVHTLTLTDLTGRLIWQTKASSDAVELDLAWVGQGVYLLERSSRSGRHVQRLVILSR